MFTFKTLHRADVSDRPLAITLVVLLAGLLAMSVAQDQFYLSYPQPGIHQAENIWPLRQPSRF